MRSPWQTLRDDGTDILIDLTARRGRTVLLLLSVALSTGVLCAAIAVNAAAARQVDADLAAAGTSTLTVTLKESQLGTEQTQDWFPPDTDARAEALPLVIDAGRRIDLPAEDYPATRLRRATPTARGEPVSCLTSGYLAAAGATTTASAALLDSPHPPRVLFLGSEAARRLGVTPGSVDPGVLVWINDDAYPVLGSITSDTETDLDSLIAIPYYSCLDLTGISDAMTTVLVRTEPGGGAPVARVVRSAIRPDQPNALQTSQVVDFDELRIGLSSSLARLAAGVGVLLLALAALLIANSMVVSVVSRTPEIGLRRSMGASRGAIARLFLLEGALVGALGGLAGTALGALAAVIISALNGWSASIPGWLYPLTPSLGLLVGIVATAYPASRAALTQPAEAIRSE